MRRPPLISLLGTLTEALADLVLPVSCAGCAAPGDLLCRRCAPGLAGPAFPALPDPAPPGLPACWAVTPYSGAVRQTLLGFKERGRRELAAPLGAALATAVAAGCPGGQALLVPVPSRRAVARARGGDHVARLAAAASRELHHRGRAVAVAAVLRVERRVVDSAGLRAEQRAENLRGAFRATTAVPVGRGTVLVLVDDLVTTGATLTEAARALRTVTRAPVTAAVIAATQRRVVLPGKAVLAGAPPED